MAVRVIKMDRGKNECFGLLPHLHEAMLEFGREYQQRGMDVMCRRYELDFISETRNAIAWVAWDDDARQLRGHIVAFVEPLFDVPVVYVQQLHIESRYITDEMRQSALADFDQWARDRGCAEIMAVARVDCPRLWKRYGFEPWRALYRKTL